MNKKLILALLSLAIIAPQIQADDKTDQKGPYNPVIAKLRFVGKKIVNFSLMGDKNSLKSAVESVGHARVKDMPVAKIFFEKTGRFYSKYNQIVASVFGLGTAIVTAIKNKDKIKQKGKRVTRAFGFGKKKQEDTVKTA